MSQNLDANFWNDRYLSGATGWDIGYPSTPLKEYIDQVENKDLQILIPGAGNAYEAEYLFDQGFNNVTVLDISEQAILSFKSRMPLFPEHQLIHQDFFEHNKKYDLILEQTFFCALYPSLRKQYALKMNELLKINGLLVGVMFNTILEKTGPPFGGTIEEYKELFSSYFTIEKLEPCYNSIPPRAGAEAFIRLRKMN